MNKKSTNSASVNIPNVPFSEETGAGAVSLPPPVTLAIRAFAEAYLSAEGFLSEEDEEFDGDDLVNRLSLDIAGCALLESAAGVRGRNVGVSHCAVFTDQVDAGAFCSAVQFHGYQVLALTATGVGNEHVVNFSHLDKFGHDNLCQRTIFLFRQALSYGGAYVGWQVKYGEFTVGARDQGLLRHIAASR